MRSRTQKIADMAIFIALGVVLNLCSFQSLGTYLGRDKSGLSLLLPCGIHSRTVAGIRGRVYRRPYTRYIRSDGALFDHDIDKQRDDGAHRGLLRKIYGVESHI